MDMVFKALADPGRRLLLDRLRQDNGQTLGQLCEYLEMARQSVSQHLAVLESANLVTSVRRGRLKLHYLNPVPLHEIAHRWIQEFEYPRLRRATGAEGKRRGGRYDHDRRQAIVCVRDLYPQHPREGVGGAHRRRRHRTVLGPQQCVGLAARFTVGAPAHGRIGNRRRRGRGDRIIATAPAGHHVRRRRRGGPTRRSCASTSNRTTTSSG